MRRDIISAPAQPDELFGRLVLEHPGAVVILARRRGGAGAGAAAVPPPALLRFVELPAGLLDVEDEDPLVAAQRELREEALLVAEQWTHLFTTYSSPGLSSEKDHLLPRAGALARRPTAAASSPSTRRPT